MGKINWKNLGNKIKGVANGLAKVGSLIPGSIGAACRTVDALIPDEQQANMAAAAARSGNTSVSEVEKTIRAAAAAQGAPVSESDVQSMTKALAAQVASATGTPVNNSGASTTVTKSDKFKVWFAKYKWFVIGGGAGVVALVLVLCLRKKGSSKSKRRY